MNDGAPSTWRVKFDGTCSRCGRELLKGMPAVWERAAKKIRCVECPAIEGTDSDGSSPFTGGVGGASARREYDRRMKNRDAAARDRWGNGIGGLVLALTEAPGTTKAWASGAQGEERLAAALDATDGVRALHDRRVPGTKGNIGHLVVGPGGVFVVDAKNHNGMVQVRDRGGLFRTDLRLYVGSHDWSKLADGLAWQVQAVRATLDELVLEPKPTITPALCFIEADWPLFRPPSAFRGVRLESLKSLISVVTSPGPLDAASIQHVTEALAREFPPT